jgi:hypothetical protein
MAFHCIREYQMSSQHTAIAVTFENAIIFPFEIQMLQFYIQIAEQQSRASTRNGRVTADVKASDCTSRLCKRTHCQIDDETIKFSIFPRQGKPLYISHDYHHNSCLQFIITQAGGAQFILLLTRSMAIERVDHAY